MYRLFRYTSLQDEVRKDHQTQSRLHVLLDRDDTRANAILYLLLRSVDEFQTKYQRYPGTLDRQDLCDLFFWAWNAA